MATDQQFLLLFASGYPPITERVGNARNQNGNRGKRFLAPLAEGQQAIVMALCPSCVRPSVHCACVLASVNSSFNKLLLRNF